MRRYVLERSIVEQDPHRRRARVSGSPRRDGDDSSTRVAYPQPGMTGGTLRGALAATGVAGAACLAAATFLPVIRIEQDGTVLPALDSTGWDLHGPALLVLAALAATLLPLALRGSAAAPLALAFAGLGGLAIALFGDLPDIDQAGLVGERLAGGRSIAGVGAYLEAAGSLLLVTVGATIALRRAA